MEKIKVIIKKDGSLEYEVKGVKGKGCMDLTKFIDKLSGKILENTKTSEYHEREDPSKVRTRG